MFAKIILVALFICILQTKSIEFKHPIFKSLDPQNLEDFKTKIIKTVKEYNFIQESKYKFTIHPTYVLPEDDHIELKIAQLNDLYSDWIKCKDDDMTCDMRYGHYYNNNDLVDHPNITDKVELANRFLKVLSPSDRIVELEIYLGNTGHIIIASNVYDQMEIFDLFDSGIDCRIKYNHADAASGYEHFTGFDAYIYILPVYECDISIKWKDCQFEVIKKKESRVVNNYMY